MSQPKVTGWVTTPIGIPKFAKYQITPDQYSPQFGSSSSSSSNGHSDCGQPTPTKETRFEGGRSLRAYTDCVGNTLWFEVPVGTTPTSSNYSLT